MAKYFGNWIKYEDVKASFAGYNNTYDLKGFPTAKDIIFAGYFDASWNGWARVLYRKGDKLFEVEASHCSCNGIEGQWGHGGEVVPKSLAGWPEYQMDGPYDVEPEARAAWRRIVTTLNRKARA